jgi:hypothetical protein
MKKAVVSGQLVTRDTIIADRQPLVQPIFASAPYKSRLRPRTPVI